MLKGNKSKFKFKKEENLEEEKYKAKMINLREESSDDNEESESDINDTNKSENLDEDSISDSYDEEMPSLLQLNKLIEKNNKKKNKMSNSNNKSLLNKKTLLSKNSIIYDENKGGLINTFTPSVEELNNFLLKCQVQKISIESLSEVSFNKSKKYVFDPDKWVESNKIDKKIINMEDLTLYHIKDEHKNNQIQNSKISQSIKIKEDKNKIKIKEENEEKLLIYKNQSVKDNNLILQKIISSQILNEKDKQWLNTFLNEISETDIKEIIMKDKNGRDEKLELVFDLDNTCIFSFIFKTDYSVVKNKQNLFSKKGAKIIRFTVENEEIYNALIIRKGLKELTQYVKPLCNFHIYTLGIEAYGIEIKKILSEYCGINFVRFKGRKNQNEYRKKISELGIEKEKTIILDDKTGVWINEQNDEENVIISKNFYDEETVYYSKDYESRNDKYALQEFLKSYNNFYYNRIIPSNIDWKNQEISNSKNVLFYQYKNNNTFNYINYNKCFTYESLNSEKLQLLYMKSVIKQIYCLKYLYNIDIPLAIKLIRISTLSNLIFDLKYLNLQQKNVLVNIVKACGGMIYDNNKINSETVYVIASQQQYVFNKEKINNYLKMNPNFVLINEKFILDTYFYMTNIKENINDPEYRLDEFN